MKVREVIKLLENDGWFPHKTKGSHRHFKHPTKPGKVTVPGQMGKDIQPRTLNYILKQASLKKGDVN